MPRRLSKRASLAKAKRHHRRAAEGSGEQLTASARSLRSDIMLTRTLLLYVDRLGTIHDDGTHMLSSLVNEASN